MGKNELLVGKTNKLVNVVDYNELDGKQLVEAVKAFEVGKEQPAGRFEILERLK